MAQLSQQLGNSVATPWVQQQVSSQALPTAVFPTALPPSIAPAAPPVSPASVAMGTLNPQLLFLEQQEPTPPTATTTTTESNIPEGAQSEHPEVLLERALLMGFKRRYKESLDLLEQAQRLLQQDYWGVNELRSESLLLRLQAEQIWQRFLYQPKEEAAHTLRRISELSQRVQAEYPRSANGEVRSVLLHYKGRVLWRQGHCGQAARLFKEALLYCLPDTLQTARVLDSLAIHYERIGHFTQAMQLFTQALGIKQKVGPLHEQAQTYHGLGKLCLLIEQTDEAQRHLERASYIATQLDDYRRVASLRNDLIKVAILNNQLARAEDMITQALAENEQAGLWADYGMALLYQTYLLFLRHEYEEASTLLHQNVLPLFEEHPNEKGIGIAYRLKGALANVFGRRREALEAMSEAITIFKGQHRYQELAKTYFEQAKLYGEMNHTRLAMESLLKALDIAESNRLLFLLRPIEEELFALAPERWEEVMDQRANPRGLNLAAPRGATAFNLLASATEEGAQSHAQGDVLASLSEGEESGHGEGLATHMNRQAFLSLLRLGQAIAAERDLDNMLRLVRTETVKALGAERCTVFVYDAETHELWSKLGHNEHETLRIPAHAGLAGYVFKLGECINIPDVYADPRFNKEVDKKTGHATRNLLCMPIRNRNGQSIGVIQVLNKQQGTFSATDEELLSAIVATTGITLENVMLAHQQKRAFESFIITLSSTIDARDPITAGHSERVADYSLLIGEEFQMASPDLEALRYASLLHDIGKIGIREEVLTKEGRLTVDEYKHIQEHVRYTFEILKHIHFDAHLKEVPHIAAAHHERVDGKGYFRGLKQNEIPFSGRILALSDVFDAVTSLRHYRNRMPFDKVLKIIRKDANSHFDGECVEKLFKVPLYRLAKVLVRERRVKKMAEVGSLIKYIDKSVTLAEFETLLNKQQLSKAEANLNQVFSSVYYVFPSSEAAKRI
jgi:HD-GYP domain-containing protein (c-di-GMP phosphodiesterase class II)/tetratricopeptide (TPR) repeat protein